MPYLGDVEEEFVGSEAASGPGSPLAAVADSIAAVRRERRAHGVQLVVLDPFEGRLLDGSRLCDLLTDRGLSRDTMRLWQDVAAQGGEDRLLADCRNGDVAVLIVASPAVLSELQDSVKAYVAGAHFVRFPGEPVAGTYDGPVSVRW
jgi:hypothetical protein